MMTRLGEKPTNYESKYLTSKSRTSRGTGIVSLVKSAGMGMFDLTTSFSKNPSRNEPNVCRGDVHVINLEGAFVQSPI